MDDGRGRGGRWPRPSRPPRVRAPNTREDHGGALRSEPELLQHAQLVRHRPVLDHFAAVEPADVDLAPLSLLVHRLSVPPPGAWRGVARAPQWWRWNGGPSEPVRDGAPAGRTLSRLPAGAPQKGSQSYFFLPFFFFLSFFLPFFLAIVSLLASRSARYRGTVLPIGADFIPSPAAPPGHV